jgi:DNA (cytosine-5)-methyltransferase 1
MTVCGPCGRDQAFLRRRRRPRYDIGLSAIGIVDLFCGGGGLTLGFVEAARRLGRSAAISLALDSDPEAVDVYRDNFPTSGVRLGLVESMFDGELGGARTRSERKVRAGIGEPAILAGGAPCQGHSDLNNHTRRKDGRNGLYLRVARAAEVLEPKVVCIENVPTVLKDRGRVVAQTKAALSAAGFIVDDAVIELGDVGVPQRRRRHILLAAQPGLFKPADIFASLRPPCKTHERRSVRWAIHDLLRVGAGDDFDSSSRPSSDNERRMKWLFAHKAYDLPNARRPDCHRDKDHSYVSMYGRLRWDEPAQTITTGFGSMGQGRFVHPSRPRTLTPHEAARLQTFPDFFSFRAARTRRALARMIGNAVPPLLTVALGLAVIPKLQLVEDEEAA